MPWVETESLSFTARHDSGDASCAERTLDRMEDLRLRLEDRFEEVPGDVTVVVHTNPALLALAHPFLPAARWSAAPAGRRYLAGWAMATELHVLNDLHVERRAAGDDSREALRGTAERLYAQLVIAANNPDLPPSWTPGRFARYLGWAWLVEGGAQYFARQVGLFRAAVIRRLRESARPSFPPRGATRSFSAARSSTCSRPSEALRHASGSPCGCSPAGPSRRSKRPSTPESAKSRQPGATTCAKWSVRPWPRSRAEGRHPPRARP